MSDRLRALGVRSEFYTCEQKGHFRAFMDFEALQSAMAFLDAELKGAKEEHPVSRRLTATHQE